MHSGSRADHRLTSHQVLIQHTGSQVAISMQITTYIDAAKNSSSRDKKKDTSEDRFRFTNGTGLF